MPPKLTRALVVIIVLCGIGGIGGYVMLKLLPAEPDWLYGRWWYEARGNEPQDSLWFKPKGQVDFLSEDEKLVRRCRYTTLVEDQVTVRCQQQGKVTNLVFKFREANGVRDLSDRNGRIYFKQ